MVEIENMAYNNRINDFINGRDIYLTHGLSVVTIDSRFYHITENVYKDTLTLLRNMLLKQLDNGAFEPRKLKREKVKEVLLSFRRTLQETERSECTKSSVATFDYV